MQVINIAPKGAQILPIGIEVNPAVILINPQGLAVWVSTACLSQPARTYMQASHSRPACSHFKAVLCAVCI